jgi:predicted PurR-regulated permease PerM
MFILLFLLITFALLFYMKAQYTKYILAAISILIVLALLYALGEIVSYVVIAWAVSMIGAPLAGLLRKYVGRNLAAFSTLLVFISIFILLIYTFVPVIVNQAGNLARLDYDKVFSSLEEPITDWKNWLVEKKLIDEETFVEPSSDDNANSGKSELSDYVFQQEMTVDSIFNPRDSLYYKNINLVIKVDASDFLEKRRQDELLNTPPKTPDFFDKLKENLMYFLNPARLQGVFTSTVSAFGSILIGVMSVLFISFFFLREQGLFTSMIVSAVPRGYEEKTQLVLDQLNNLLVRYFIGILGQMTVITVFVSLVLSLLGFENALLIGFFAALMNVIPYLGPILGATFGVIITISSYLEVGFYDELLPKLVTILGVFGAMQLLDNLVLQPNIFSKSVKAHPLEIFIVVLTGAKLGGILGMVLAIPLYTVIRVIAKVFLSEFKIVENLTKNL